MAKKKYEEQDGVWRTIGGRRVFIRTGVSLSQAMKDSGKFKNMRKDIQDNVEFKDINEKQMKRQGVTANEYRKAEDRVSELKKEYRALETEIGAYDDDEFMSGSPAHDELKWELKDKKDALREAQQKYDDLMKKDGFIERKYSMPVEKDSRTQKELLEDRKRFEAKMAKKYNDKEAKEFDEKYQKRMSELVKEQDEYDLYKRAQENPDSIDPMTENSTDWEALDKKYSARFEKESIEANKPAGQKTSDLIKDLGVRTFADEIKDKDIESSIKSLFIYKDEKGMGSLEKDPLKRYYDKYGKENVDRVWKQMDKKYDVIKGTSIDTEGLRYNNLIEKDKYNPEAIQKYKDATKRAWENYYGDSRKYNEEVGRAREEFERSKKSDYDHFAGWELYSDDPNRYGDIVRNHNESNALKDRYQGTYNYLQSTTNMSGAEILELLKKIDEDKK